VSEKKALHYWSLEKLALKSKADVETIRKHALNKNVPDLVVMCDLDLEKRKALAKPRGLTSTSPHSSDEFVEGYHFVCKRARGVTEDSAGKFRTGSWVVAESNVQKSLTQGAYVALHESRPEISYRQGKLLGYRRAIRDMLAGENGGETKIEEGIEFLVEETARSYSWVGEATGEKGYKWSKVSSTVSISHEGEKQP
jgi:hypothetical protein